MPASSCGRGGGGAVGEGWEKIADRTYAYTYGKRGNITKITEKVGSGTAKEKASYTYDALGQLKTENNVDLGQRIVYTYDAGGNISSKKIYAYTNGTVGSLIDTINYTYETTWKDQLKTYDGQSIDYDAIGNPKIYRDGMTFTWNGRQMQTANLNGTAVTYKYNADGLRTYKKVGSTVHEYEYSGGKLFYEKRGDVKFYYRYDAFGNLAAITRIKANGDIFNAYVICNSRGDVEELRKTTGELYARYVYDSWGNVLHVYDANGAEVTSSTHLAVQNPFRYRGYYYDAESGLYYLQSRYYDPVTGRFLNADSIVDSSDVLGFNMYAYCGNNPVSRSDSSGHAWETIWDIISLGASIAEVVANPVDPWAWAGLLGDVVDVVVPFVGGLGEAVDAVKTVSRVVDKGDDIIDAAKNMRRAADAADDIKDSTGAYVILYEQGQHYIGKGGFNRAITSATEHLTETNKVSSIIWAPTPSKETAFVTEYLLQSMFGVGRNVENTFNIIWSPGKKIFNVMQ